MKVAVLAVSWMTPVKAGLRPDHLAKPVHDHLFHLGGGGAGLPAHALGADAGGGKVAEDRGVTGVAGEVGEKGWDDSSG